MSDESPTSGRSTPESTPHLDTGVYAVDGLSDEERAIFERALDQDPALAEETAGLQATAAQLGLAAVAVPPAALRAAVLAEVDRTRQDRLSSDQPPPPPADLEERRRLRRGVRLLTAAAALLTVLVLGLGAYAVNLRQDNTALTDAGAQVTRVLTAPDARTASATVPGQDGRAAVVVSDSLSAAVLVGADMSPAPAGSTYQLWYLGSDGSARSAGTFEAAAAGTTAVPLEGTPSGAASVGMTVEPAGGSAQPTSAPVLVIPLS